MWFLRLWERGVIVENLLKFNLSTDTQSTYVLEVSITHHKLDQDTPLSPLHHSETIFAGQKFLTNFLNWSFDSNKLHFSIQYGVFRSCLNHHKRKYSTSHLLAPYICHELSYSFNASQIGWHGRLILETSFWRDAIQKTISNTSREVTSRKPDQDKWISCISWPLAHNEAELVIAYISTKSYIFYDF